ECGQSGCIDCGGVYCFHSFYDFSSPKGDMGGKAANASFYGDGSWIISANKRKRAYAASICACVFLLRNDWL
ncbi:MAG: hypothetical protein IJN21_09505, partial [Clostridia bacterium]|nr:hypothetical protein [Clostridia bacterium]